MLERTAQTQKVIPTIEVRINYSFLLWKPYHNSKSSYKTILLMDKILHDLKDSKLWELWYIPYIWVMQDFVHQPYLGQVAGFVQALGFRP